MVILIIIKDLIKAVSYCLASGIILKCFKEFIIIVLRKKRKKNYFFLSSYRPITFKNILVKVLKKYIANIMSKAAENYRLLLWN